LQSIRALSRPSGSNAIVYFDLSSGVKVVSSLPWNFTSRHDVPPKPTGAGCGVAAMPASDPLSGDDVQYVLPRSKPTTKTF
jgi:hypothetical protein